MHNYGDRVTVIYSGLGAYTFNLKKAKSLFEPSDWMCEYKGQSFHVPLRFSNSRDLISGSCQVEDKGTVDVSIALRHSDTNHWEGYYETEDEMVNIIVQDMQFDEIEKTFSADWFDRDTDTNYVLRGAMGRKNKRDQSRPVDFTFEDGKDTDRVKKFIGKIDMNRSRMGGFWHYEDDPENKYFFDFWVAVNVPGTLRLTFQGQPPI